MNFKMSNKNAYSIEIIGIILHIIFIAIGMLTYAGGTRDNPSLSGYTFWYNTFSDLGRLTAYNGKSNLTSMILFSVAYCTLAATMLPFYLVFPRLFNDLSLEKKLTKIGGTLGIISSIAFFLVVAAPVDILFTPHMIFAITAYIAILFMSILYTVALFLNKRFPKVYTYGFIIFSVMFFIFLIMALIALTLGIRSLLTIGQKIGTIAFLICFPILTYGAWQLEKE